MKIGSDFDINYELCENEEEFDNINEIEDFDDSDNENHNTYRKRKRMRIISDSESETKDADNEENTVKASVDGPFTFYNCF